ncbi:MAG TPA: prolipoprotein diacylglyceryl transferase [Mycobacterium sp.]|nr:prolipoprotein diacylglyceryl transferase [Mycobacterium sp.]
MTLTWLTYFPSPARGVWHLGPVPIRAYALCIIVGIVVALLIGDRRWQARGGERGVIYDIALWAVPFGLVGGRLYHLATDWRTYFGKGGVGLDATVRIWDGGLGIWGAVALGAVGAWIGCRRRRIPLPAFGDAIAPGIILAQAIGRIGNYFNQELYGRVTTLPWGMEIFWRQDSAGVRDPHLLDGVSTGEVYQIVQPTFLYELLWNVLVFVLLIYADRRFRMGHGRLFALYVAGYCVGRFGIELLRDDVATHIAGIRVNSFTSTFVFIGAVVYIILAPKGREDPEALRRIWQEDETEVHEPVLEPEKELAVVGAVTSGVSTAGALGDDPEAASEAEPVTQDEAVAAEAETEEAAPEVDEAAEPDEVGDAEPEPVRQDADAEESQVEGEDLSAEVPEVGDDDQPAAEAEPAQADTVEAQVEDVESAETRAPEAEDTDLSAEVPEVGDEDQPEAVAEPAQADTDEAGGEDAESAETQAPEVQDAVEEEPTEAAGDTSDEDSPDKRSRWWRRRKK